MVKTLIEKSLPSIRVSGSIPALEEQTFATVVKMPLGEPASHLGVAGLEFHLFPIRLPTNTNPGK